ncbi:MAG: ABC transporter substrate-binding protein, partial [Clostridiales bacterium]|nr:ABC transporter substrate-binding protein [Clostridiales bacterium]
KYDYSGLKVPMETWLGMKEDGSIYPGADSLDNDSARAMFAEGNVGMKFAFHFDVGVLNDQFPAKCDWGVCPYPVNEDGTGYKQRFDYGWSSLINAHTKVDPAKVLEVIKAFQSDDYQQYAFEECISMPYNTEVIEKADLSNAKKGWKEFAQLAEISAMQPRSPRTDMAGMESASDIFMNYIWTGKISVDEGIKMMNENANKAVDNYYSVHTDESRDDYVDKNWKPEMQ